VANRGCGCRKPTDTRITEAGIIEQSFDNGVTWEQATDDNRFNAPVFPPLVGIPLPDVQCAGAKSGKEAMRIVIEQFANENSAWETVLGLITLLTGLLAALIGPLAPAVVGIIMAFIWVLYTVGKAAFIAIDWEAALDTYLCILYCNIQPDASFSEAGWQQVKQDIVDQFDGLTESFLWNMVNGLGPVGLTNACRIFPGLAGDCDSCGCACDDLTLGDVGNNLVPRPDLGAGWWQVETEDGGNPADEGNGRFYATINVPACCCLTAYTYTGGLVNAPPGNRVAFGCDSVTHTGNYGLNAGLVNFILFRAYGVGIIEFKMEEICP